MYYIGIDGGGTKSRLIGVDLDGKVIGRSIGESTNLGSNSYQQVKQNIDVLIKHFIAAAGVALEDCKSFCIGSAGIDVEENIQDMTKLLKEIGIQCPIKVVNDSEIVLAAETEEDAGIVLISGTGSIAFGKALDGTTVRCGGWGHLLDDEGSAYWIGKEGVRRAFRGIDKRGDDTILIQRIVAHFQVSKLEEIIPIIYADQLPKTVIAELAMSVIEAAMEGDYVAGIILQEAASELASLVCTLVRRLALLDRPYKIILSGSTITKNPLIKEEFMNNVKEQYPHLIIADVQQIPEMGAIALAQKNL